MCLCVCDALCDSRARRVASCEPRVHEMMMGMCSWRVHGEKSKLFVTKIKSAHRSKMTLSPSRSRKIKERHGVDDVSVHFAASPSREPISSSFLILLIASEHHLSLFFFSLISVRKTQGAEPDLEASRAFRLRLSD